MMGGAFPRLGRLVWTGLAVLGAALALGGCAGQGESGGGALRVISGSGVLPGRAAAGLGDYRIAYYEAYYEAAGGVSEDAAPEYARFEAAESGEPFVIADYGPREALPAELGKPAIYVAFSQPVVPLARLGAPLRDGSAFFTIDPPLEGVYRWYGSRLLSFEPSEESLPQQRYRVTLAEGLQSLGGKPLTGERSFSFETERLSVLSWRLGPPGARVDNADAGPDDAGIITLAFSHPVNLDELAKWLRVRTAGRNWGFDLARPEEAGSPSGGRGNLPAAERMAVMRLRGLLPPDSDVELSLLEGARSEEGWLGTLQTVSWTFHTVRPLEFQDSSVGGFASPRTREAPGIPIYLTFNHALDPEGAASCFSMDGVDLDGALRVRGRLAVLNPQGLKYRQDYTVRVSGDLKDLWGQRLGRDLTLRISTGAANSYWYSRNLGPRMLEAAFPPAVVWETQNPRWVKRLIAPVRGPYSLAAGVREALDPGLFPQDSKRYFMEDLRPFLGPSGRGAVALSWEYETGAPGRSGTQESPWLSVQVTDIGITARYAYNKALVWATRLSTGLPLAGAAVELLDGEAVVLRGETDGQGLAVIDFTGGGLAARFHEPRIRISFLGREPEFSGFRIRVIEGGGAAGGGDEAEFIPNESHNAWRFSVAGRESPFTAAQERAQIFLFTDRGLYRPGETLSFRGIDRRLSQGRYEPYRGRYSAELLAGSRIVARIEGEASAAGGSFGSFSLPADLDPGSYVIRYSREEVLPGGWNNGANLSFQVANFERLRVESSLAFSRPSILQGEDLSARFSASYLAGGALAGASYSYYWTREPVGFNPGGPWQRWRFGPELTDSRSFITQGGGSLDGGGAAEISLRPQADGIEGAAYRYRLEASAQDAARQEVSSRGSAVVHPASFYIGLRLDAGRRERANLDGGATAYVLSAGSPAALSWALVSPEGEPYRGGGELRAVFVRHEWKQARQAGVGGRVNLIWERVETVVEERRVDASGGQGSSGALNFTPPEAGSWEARLSGRDGRGRPVFTRLSFYVSGSGWVRWGSQDSDAITLTPDKALYAPGERAKLLVQSPLPRGRYLLTVEREGIFEERLIDIEGSAQTVEVPIRDSYIPVVYVALSTFSVRSGPPGNSYFEPDLDKPRGIFGLTALAVDTSSRRYQVEIEPSRGAYRPGEEAELRLRVLEGGRPAPGVELSFMAVDRGVVDLIDYHVRDPLAFFYEPFRFPLAVRGADSRSLLIDPVTYTLSDLQGGDREDGSKLEERSDFRPTAVFEPCLITGRDGTVSLKFRLPDSLTTYRCTAVAAGARNFGIAERDLPVSAPLTASAAMPRKLRLRDTGQVSLILTNLENRSVDARVSLDIQDAEGALPEEPAQENPVLVVDGKRELSLRIGSGASVEAAFRVAAVGAGSARLVFTLRSPQVNERVIRELRVDRPVVEEAVTVMGNLGPSSGDLAEEGLVLPSGPALGSASLSVVLSASRLAALKDAVGYLFSYPYGCLEQRSARLLPVIAFADHLETFDLETPLEDPRALAAEELDYLFKNRLPNGAYPYWPGDNTASYFVSLRAGHIIALARAKGYALPADLEVSPLLTFLSSSREARNAREYDPFLWGYSLWVRAMLGDRTGGDIGVFLNRGDEIGIAGFCFAGLAALELDLRDLARSARDRVRRFIRPGARSLDITDTAENRSYGAYWAYDTDNYALALMLYQALNPDDDMTTRLANALVDRQRRLGYWNNTSSTFWGILAFSRVAGAEAAEAAGAEASGTPGAWAVSLGGRDLLRADPRTGLSVTGLFPLTGPPLSELPRNTLLPLRFERAGGFRLYYHASLRYGIPSELAPARDEGLGVFAETLDGDGNPVTNGKLSAGKVYTRRVVVSSPRTRTWVALRAPVPSGAEIIDASFVTSSTVPPPPEEPDPWQLRTRPPRQFVMDDEIRFHWDYFAQGRREAVFRFRAVMPGVYPTPPAQAECMYEGEVFGRSAGELIVIQ